MELEFLSNFVIELLAAEQIFETIAPRHSKAPSREPQYPGHSLRQLCPVLFFIRQLPSACRCDRVIARTTVVFRGAPLRPQPTCLSHPVQGRIERSFFETQALLRNLLDMQRDTVTVHGPSRSQGLQHEEIKSALQAVVGVF